MSILISPSDNTGWGVGTRLMRSTGLVRTARQPVSVRHYYRSMPRDRETVVVTEPRLYGTGPRRRRRTVRTRTIRVRTVRPRRRRTATVIV